MNNMFRCGCTSDVQGSPTAVSELDCDDQSLIEHERNEDEDEDEALQEQEPRRTPQHDSKDDGNSSFSSSARDEKGELQMESAKHYMERISKQVTASNEESKNRNTKKPNAMQACGSESESIAAVFRMSTRSTSTINIINARTTNHYPSLKHTDSESTQSTAAISDDEFSYSLSSEDAEYENDDDDEATSSQTEESSQEQQPISILRRRLKLGAITAPTGSAVKFCPTTIFPNPNTLQKRKRVKRLPKVQQQSQQEMNDEQRDQQLLEIITVACESYDNSHYYQYSDDELRRLERRAQQRQHGHFRPYTTHEIRSPTSELLFPTESFYVFR